MTNKTTKSALLTSSISLLLCFAMLLGTTFAWFTDSVTSANNIITAGNLDVELYYQNDEVTTWTKVESNTNVFKEETLWEPGHTEVVKLKIVNEGTLALKYQLGVNVASETGSVNIAGNEFKLSDYIKFGIVDGEFTGNREAAIAATEDNATALNVAYTSAITELLEAGENFVTMVVYMPTSVGNEANYGKGQVVPTINLGINLAATQFTNEEDSFDEMYDESANVPDVTVFNATDLQTALDEAEAGKTTVIALADDITEDIEITRKANTDVVIDGNGKTVSGAITLDGKSATITSGGVVIQNVNFNADTIDEDACIRLGDGTNATRYVCNVTVKNCTFDVPGKVGVKSYTGGDKNIRIIGCTATANAHSLAQLKGVDGVVIEDCKVNSKNGINFNNSTNVTVTGCTVNTKGYAVRFGESQGGSGAAETYLIENCTLKSACDDGDAVIIIRGTADYSTLTIANTTIEGTTEITNTATGATVIR